MSIKRILSFLFVLVIISGIFVVSADAADVYEYTDKNGVTFYYAIYEDNGKTRATVGYCKYKKDSGFTLTIPSKLGGYPVGAISDECFEDKGYVEAVKLPDTLEYIGDKAFYNSGLKSVTLPESVTHIGDEAFANTDIKSVSISKNVAYIGENAFDNLESYKVSGSNKYYKSADGVLYTKDGKYLLDYPTKKKDAKFAVPEGVEYIYNKSFWSTSNLKKITFPKTLVGIGEAAFSYSGLEYLHLTENLVYIGKEAFYYCDDMKSVTADKNAYPYFELFAFTGTPLEEVDGIAYISHMLYENNCYDDNRELKIKEGTTAICQGAFGTGLNNIVLNIPSTLMHIPAFVFRNIAVKEFKVSKDNPYYTAVEGHLYTKDKKTLVLMAEKESDTFTLSDTTEAIWSGAFDRRDVTIKHLIVPESVKMIYDNAFTSGEMTQVTFRGIPDFVGEDVFSSCDNLEKVNLPDGCAKFGIEDFMSTPYWYRKEGNYLLSGTVLLGHRREYGLSYINVNAQFTAVGRKAFMGKDLVNKLTLPDTLVAVGDYAFANCPKLKEVYIPATVDEIGAGAFGFIVAFDEDTGALTSYKKVEGFVIKGYTNSLAESYADANGFEFVSVGYVEPESTLLGDIDCDGRLTVKDATFLQKYVAGMVGLNTQDKINADFNGDGKINVRDATAIQKKLAHII